jgi:hypothetical protein
MTGTETSNTPEPSHVESQGPFHRFLVQRDSCLCLPVALFDNMASEARDHCGMTLDIRLDSAYEQQMNGHF